MDLFLHFLVGAIITIIGLKYNFRIIIIFLFLLVLALVKELHDYFFVYKTNMSEYIFDFLVSFIYIPLIIFTRKLKKSLDHKAKNQKSMY